MIKDGPAMNAYDQETNINTAIVIIKSILKKLKPIENALYTDTRIEIFRLLMISWIPYGMPLFLGESLKNHYKREATIIKLSRWAL